MNVVSLVSILLRAGESCHSGKLSADEVGSLFRIQDNRGPCQTSSLSWYLLEAHGLHVLHFSISVLLFPDFHQIKVARVKFLWASAMEPC